MTMMTKEKQRKFKDAIKESVGILEQTQDHSEDCPVSSYEGLCPCTCGTSLHNLHVLDDVIATLKESLE